MRVADGKKLRIQSGASEIRDTETHRTQSSSLTLLCYTDAQDHESTDQTSDCNAGEQQMLQDAAEDVLHRRGTTTESTRMKIRMRMRMMTFPPQSRVCAEGTGSRAA